MISVSNSGLVVLVLPKIFQFFDIMSLSGGLFGLCVVIQLKATGHPFSYGFLSYIICL